MKSALTATVHLSIDTAWAKKEWFRWSKLHSLVVAGRMEVVPLIPNCYGTVAGIVSLTVAFVRFHSMCIARVEVQAYPTSLPQHGVRLLHPRAFGRILDGIGGGRADGPS